MLKVVVAAGIALGSASFTPAAVRQGSALDHALMRTVSVHFREISAAGMMDFLASHGINVAARTGDINLREEITLNVTNQTMHDVMLAVAGALGAQWTRSGQIFVLSRMGDMPGAQQGGPGSTRSWNEEGQEVPDAELAFQEAAAEPTALVYDDGGTIVNLHSTSSMKRASLLRLTPSGDWAVAEQWHTSSKMFAHTLKPRLSIGQRKLLAKNGYLALEDLTEEQRKSAGDIWPDGKYHAISNGHTLLIHP